MTGLLLRLPQTRPTTDSVGWLTLYLVLLLFLPTRLIVGPLGSAGAPSLLFGLGSLLLWLLTFVGAARRAVTEPQPIRIALGILLFCVGVTYVLAMTRPISADEVSPADVGLLALASWSGTLLLTHDGIHQRSRLDTLIWRFAVCGGLLAALGLIQIATRQLWVDQLSVPGLVSGPSYTLGARGGYPRPPGTATHPIEYGVILSMILPIALHVGFSHTHRPLLVRWLPAAAVAAVIPLTSSRSAYLGAAIALLVCLIGWAPERRRRVVAVTAAGVLAMVVLTPNFVGSIVGLFSGAGDDPSITSRTDGFAFAGDFIARDPWFGRGLGTLLPKYRIFDNQYLLLLVTIGIIGTLAFLALGVTAAVTLFRLRARLRAESSRDLALALAAAICAGFSCLFMFDAFAFPMTMGTLFLILGLAGALRRIEDADASLGALLR
ncbi:O-antigen ligase family protein [Microbacterium sp. zg.B48]|uniref:O-antigen ligase family protein n=1 Tax=unclassified Microbacterium TaxID=2609290 RepID=UPI00214BBD16|nr:MULTISPECIES: O-antigen ligase family protein [unclassified Microbacterium]MCR2764193.1 O-antigen ligase family protein [Microbacterium sp. zg.B48]MCR2808940.1 O-antigen ligase family protein [Microbacterium sp. zg.B185]WIM18643.1 O-antigen ligase family protein [Microbacterium sp. zg-B185]